MSLQFTEEAVDEGHPERRVIRIDNVPDQAGIAAALRRAFAARPATSCFGKDDPFAALLKQIH